MEYKSNNKEEVVAVIETGNFTELRLTNIYDAKGNVASLDVRIWYWTSKNPEKKPSKGIRIAQENLADVINAILHNVSSDTMEDLRNMGYDM